MDITTSVRLRTTAARMTQTELAAAQTLLAERFTTMILVNSDEQLFVSFDLVTATEERWREGRAFGPEMEFRWRRKGTDFAVCFLSESDLVPEQWQAEPAKFFQRSLLDLCLWGRFDTAYTAHSKTRVWIEDQIPRLLDYPIQSAPEQVALRVARYWHPAGSLAFWRFVELVAWTGEGR